MQTTPDDVVRLRLSTLEALDVLVLPALVKYHLVNVAIWAAAALQAKVEIAHLVACNVILVSCVPYLPTHSTLSVDVCRYETSGLAVAFHHLACFVFTQRMLLVALQICFLIGVGIFAGHTAILLFHIFQLVLVLC